MIDIKSKEIKEVDIESIVENPKNNNRHSVEQIERLAKIIKFNGFRDPLIISNRSGFLITGHARLAAAKQLGMKTLPVVFQDFKNEAEEYQFLTAHNEIARWSQLDRQSIYDNMNEYNIDVELYGIEDFKLPEIEESSNSNPDNVPEVKKNPKTKPGDVWLLGKHRLMCGDSAMIDQIEKMLNGEKADMVFTDPPYNQETRGGAKGKIRSALLKQSSNIEHLCDFNPKEFLQILPNVFNGNLNSYIFTSKDLLPDYLMWAKDNKYSFNVLVWKKPTAIPIGGTYRPDIEYMLTIRKSGIFNGGLKNVNYSKVMEYSREGGLHPTMKPVSLLENHILIGSNNNSLVVDLFLGSGSTLIACEKTNRKCYGMELDPVYCDVIINRWQNFTKHQAVLESSGAKYDDL